ncbi:MAG TPA: FMN-binding protein, partial [Candidatus Blautia ornithocaccae]|nr:FMN-binding protein [Candidatus Blautia ornithocaccae]
SQGGSEGTQEGTEVDGVSGATISSTAAVKGINAAYEFLQTID